MATLGIECSLVSAASLNAAQSAAALPVADPVAIGDSGISLGAEQFASLKDLYRLAPNTHPFDIYEKAGRVIVAQGEEHVKTKKTARAAQKVVQVFPLRGIENTKPEEYESTDYFGTYYPLNIFRVITRKTCVSAIDAVGVEYLNRVRQDRLKKEVEKCLKGAVTESGMRVQVHLSATGYERDVFLDMAEARALIGQEQHFESVNAGHSPVLLEMGRIGFAPEIYGLHFLYLSASFFVLSLELSILGSIFGFLSSTAPNDALKIDIANFADLLTGIAGSWMNLVLGCLIVSVASFYGLVLNRKNPREVAMARNADTYMMNNPPDPIMLAIMGQLHLSGFGKMLMEDHGWRHIASAATLFGQ
ncbi:MAG: hypothetical protein Q7T03_01005 [Deltaproteobacteria bacterium]|nr:hypothetical protein [Deltaproteobacteria bacterium]